MRITVAKDSCDNPAPPITETALVNQSALIERGKAELYTQCSNRIIHTINVPYQYLIETGNMIEIVDYEQGESWIGKVLSVAINAGTVDLDQTVTIEQVA